MTRLHARVLLLFATLVLAGCGSSAKHTSSGASQSATQSTPAPPPAVAEIAAAERPSASQFPPARGRTLRQLARLVRGSAQLGAATGTYTPGLRRMAFALNTTSGAFIYAPTAVYIAPNPNSPAQGPFLAPADPMAVALQYRSKQNAGPGGIQAIYAAHVPVAHPGTFTVLSLTRTPSGLIGAPGQIAAAASFRIPDVGQRPPGIATDTAGTVHGNVALLTTRVPPESMQSVSFNQVLGKQPVALLFSTPQLCMSKVCGPVTDVAAQLQHQFSGRVTFIHEEVYVGNDPTKGLRPQMKAFHLETEPWLFTVNRQGRIAARLEGAFGVNEFRQAIEAALR